MVGVTWTVHASCPHFSRAAQKGRGPVIEEDSLEILIIDHNIHIEDC